MHASLNTSRAIAVVASSIGLCCACGLGGRGYTPPAPPELISVSATELQFSTAIGTTSPPQQVTVTNRSTLTVPIKALKLNWPEPNRNSYTMTSTCGLALAPSTTCTLTFLFSPNPPRDPKAYTFLKFAAGEVHFIHLIGKITKPEP